VDGRSSVVRLIGSSLLAVLATAALVIAVFLYFAAWVTGTEMTGWVADVGTVAVVITASLALVYGLVAAYGAWATWRDRSIGRMIGLAASIVAILASGTTLLVGEVAGREPLLYVAMGLGAVTAVTMIVPASIPWSDDRPRGAER
jgi:hypothetical protein